MALHSETQVISLLPPRSTRITFRTVLMHIISKRAAIQCCASLVTFAIGICISVLCSALKGPSVEIHPVSIERPTTKPDLLSVDWASPSKICNVDLVNSNGQIRSVDFCNFRFPGFYDKQIALKDGRQEITREIGGTIYTFHDVLLVDFTGDGRKEALVSIEDFSGAGSSGVSYNYYVYTMRSGRLFLLWRVTTGSEGLAGLKDFKLDGKNLVFEVFGNSSIVGRHIIGGGLGGECCPDEFSRITVAWTRGRFRQVRVEVFPLIGEKRR